MEYLSCQKIESTKWRSEICLKENIIKPFSDYEVKKLEI